LVAGQNTAIDATTLRNELDGLTRELGQLLRSDRTPHDGSDAYPIAGALAAAIESLDLGDAGAHVERLIRDRPIMTTASAFALGMAIGLLLRRS
jgi:hypothetical protein